MLVVVVGFEQDLEVRRWRARSDVAVSVAGHVHAPGTSTEHRQRGWVKVIVEMGNSNRLERFRSRLDEGARQDRALLRSDIDSLLFIYANPRSNSPVFFMAPSKVSEAPVGF